jgi:hypothetical protein
MGIVTAADALRAVLRQGRRTDTPEPSTSSSDHTPFERAPHLRLFLACAP